VGSDKAIYEAYGKFAIEFEMVCDGLENLVRTVLDAEGLDNPRIQECLIAGLTAEPLSSLAQSLCYEHLRPSDEASKVIDFVFAAFRKLIQKRNDLIHGKHFIFFYDSTTDTAKPSERTFSYKVHRNKKGSTPKRTQYCSDDLNLLYNEARQSFSNITKIKHCIEHRCSIAANFLAMESGRFEAKKGELSKGA
jgi:hypothetical protein